MTAPAAARPAREAWPRIEADEAGRYRPFPLSDIQQAYWIGRSGRVELGATGLHVYEELDCEDLDYARLNAAWSRMLERHDALRTIVDEPGRQRVLPDAAYTIPSFDWSALPEAEQRRRLAELRAELCARVYAPERWPMFDIVYCAVSARRSVLFLSLDALHIDMGSFRLLFEEWVESYADPACAPPPQTVRYRDYVLGLGALENGERWREDLAFWRAEAARMAPAPELPYCGPFAAMAGGRFARLSGGLPQDAWTRLKERAAAEGLTPSSALLAAYAETLARWSRRRPFTLNVTLFNPLPLHSDLRRVVGDFTSMILLQAPDPQDAPFASAARGLQARLSEGMERRSVSGVRVLREWSAAHGLDAARAAMPVVFTSTLNHRTRGLAPLRRFGVRRHAMVRTPQVTLDLQASEDGGGLLCHWDSLEDALPGDARVAMFEAFQELVGELAEGRRWDSPRPVPVPLAQAARRDDANRTAAEFPAISIPELCMERAPDAAPAILTASGALTYGAMWGRVRATAARLLECGLRPGDFVAVGLAKSPAQAIAAHAVLAAGGAYAPVDPAWPAARIAAVLADCGARLALAASGQALAGGRLERTLEPEREPAAETVGLPHVAPDAAAYLLYTSGSTGAPKGVLVEHRSVVNRVTDVNRRFGVGPLDRLFAITALHHDLSVYDLFGAAAAGASLVLPDPDRTRDPAHWIDLMEAHGVTLWNSVPTFFEMLLDFVEPTGRQLAPSLRLVLLSGDRIPVSLPDRLARLAPGARCVSLGGPTETTVWDICRPVAPGERFARSIPYGRPMANARYWVMDERLRERPEWVAGELCIGGAGLARGYWNDEAATAASFVRHPETGERLYRSGDLGRRLPDGDIEILGRIDRQAKIRGQRIEPGEIEAALRRHTAVRDAFVGVGPDGRIAAWVTARPDPGLQFRLRQMGLRRDQDRDLHIDLAEPAGAADERRRTCRAFAPASLGLAALGAWLGRLRGRGVDSALPRYAYPSAGALYPVRAYVCAAPGRVAELDAGSYYYHPVRHRLTRVSAEYLTPADHREHNRAIAAAAAVQVLLIGHLPAIAPMYPEQARDFCLIEAGYIGQALMENAAGRGLGVCPIGDLDTARAAQALGLGADDVFLHAFCAGVPASGPEEPVKRRKRANDPHRPAPMHTRLISGEPATISAGPAPGGLEAELAALCAENLPRHMTPESIRVVDAFPLTPNGKVDARRLAEIAPGEARAGDVRAATQTESRVQQMVARLLERVEIPVDRRFFELGCNSLHLIRLLAALREIAPAVQVADLFAYPTVRSLAAFLDGDAAPDAREQALRRAARRRRSRRDEA
jgi:epothilone synthetase B